MNDLTAGQKTLIVSAAGAVVLAVIVGVCYAVPKITQQVLGASK